MTSGPPFSSALPPWLKSLVMLLVVGDDCSVHQPFAPNLTAAEIQVTEMQKNLALKKL